MIGFKGVRRIAVPSVVLLGLLGTPALTAPAVAVTVKGPKQIKDQWIVTFDSSASGAEIDAAQNGVVKRGGKVGHRYSRVARGFSAKMNAAEVAQLRSNPRVLSVEPDLEVRKSDVQSPTPSWGLDRLDQASLPLNSTYNYTNNGAGVTVYVIDTGIRTSHTDFGGRAVPGFTSINDGRGSSDCDGHGTHVAGTIGGAKYGVAKGVKLVAVRVLDCNGSGSMSGVIAGVDWVTANRSGPSVANMSLGGGAYSTLDNAVARSITAGVTYAVAAGNDNADACTQSPARAPAALTVGASTSTDARASFSNWGACLDLFAPGQSIVSAVSSSDTASASYSGTSMASPHVAGAAAAYLQTNPTATPAQVRSALIGGAVLNKVTSLLGSPNVLLQTVAGTVTPPPPPPPPPPAGSAPVAVAPTAALPAANTQHGSSSVTLTLNWSASDVDGNAITRYELQEQRGTGSWTSLYSGTGTVGTRSVSPGTATAWRVRATDSTGAVGEWATSAARTVVVNQQTAATYVSSWSNKSVSGALGGSIRQSRTAGATASLTFIGSEVQWVATPGYDRGRAEVFVDGVSRGIVDLYASSTRTRRIVFSTALAPGQHTITVKVLGTRGSSASSTWVDVDAFTVLR
ncbi:MAG: S8 family serine peptidase [Sporichthyaceae bacterium]